MRYSDTLMQTLWKHKELEKQFVFEFAAEERKRPYAEEIQAEGIRLRVSVEDFDRYGLLLHDLELCSLQGPSGEMPEKKLDHLAKCICDEITYLAGRFQCTELDRDNLAAVLRTEVVRGAENDFYYEFELTDGTCGRIRHFALEGEVSRRRATPANISTETFRRLVDHLIDMFKPGA